MFINICKYIFTAFVLMYGAFVAYEDLKSKEIHACPIAIMSVVNFFPCYFSQTYSPDYMAITIIAMTLLFVFMDKRGYWGSGDTKMCVEGLILAMWWLNPQNMIAIIAIPVLYMLVSSIIGLITVIIKRDKYPPMGHAFLITNILVLMTTIIIRNGGIV